MIKPTIMNKLMNIKLSNMGLHKEYWSHSPLSMVHYPNSQQIKNSQENASSVSGWQVAWGMGRGSAKIVCQTCLGAKNLRWGCCLSCSIPRWRSCTTSPRTWAGKAPSNQPTTSAVTAALLGSLIICERTEDPPVTSASTWDGFRNPDFP